MKLTTIYLADNKIEISNSFFGKETIKLNAEVVSQRYSIMGTEHKFTITENGENVECIIKLSYGLGGVIFSLYIDDKTIVESPQGGIFFFIIVIFIAFAVVGVNHLLSW